MKETQILLSTEEPIYNLIMSYLKDKLNRLLVTDESSDATGYVHQLNVVETEINGAESLLNPLSPMGRDIS